MSAELEKGVAAPVEPVEVRQALERILSSKYFVNAHKKKGFLRLICELYLEGRAHELNEYKLAFDALGRNSSYNPSSDPIVRVVAHEIRKKLELYYQHEGAHDEIHLELPAGSYQPVFTRYALAPVEVEEYVTPPVPRSEADHDRVAEETQQIQTAAAPDRRRMAPGTLWLSVAVLVLTFAVVALAFSNQGLRQKAEGTATPKSAPVDGMWASFMRDKTPPLVILSNPPVLRLANASDPEISVQGSIPLAPDTIEALKDKFVMNPEIKVRESSGPAADDQRAAEDKAVVKQNRVPRLVWSTNVYTGMGEAIGLHYLTDFFHAADKRIVLKQSRTLSAEDLKNHNLILLGGGWVNEWSAKFTGDEDFVFTSNGTLQNRNPQPGEEQEYIAQYDGRTGSLVVDYALVTVKPNLSDANEVMVLAGINSQGTEAAAEYVTSKSYLDQLNQRLQQSREPDGPPRYFQALLKVGVENGIPTTISVLALHKLRPSGGSR